MFSNVAQILYVREIVFQPGPWKGRDAVGFATLEAFGLIQKYTAAADSTHFYSDLLSFAQQYLVAFSLPRVIHLTLITIVVLTSP